MAKANKSNSCSKRIFPKIIAILLLIIGVLSLVSFVVTMLNYLNSPSFKNPTEELSSYKLFNYIIIVSSLIFSITSILSGILIFLEKHTLLTRIAIILTIFSFVGLALPYNIFFKNYDQKTWNSLVSVVHTNTATDYNTLEAKDEDGADAIKDFQNNQNNNALNIMLITTVWVFISTTLSSYIFFKKKE